MGLIIVLLGQVAVFPDLPQSQTAEGLLRDRLFQNLTTKEHSGKRQHFFQFLLQTATLTDAQKHLRLDPVQHSPPDDDRVILGNQQPLPQVGHLLRLFRQHGAEESLIGLRLCLRSRQGLDPLPLQPVLCRRCQPILRGQVKDPPALPDAHIVTDGFGCKDRHS